MGRQKGEGQGHPGPIGINIKAAVPSGGVAKEPDSELVHKAAYMVIEGKAKTIDEALNLLNQ